MGIKPTFGKFVKIGVVIGLFQLVYVALIMTGNTSLRFKKEVEEYQVCVHPRQDPWDTPVAEFYRKLSPYTCKEEQEWLFSRNGKLLISQYAKQMYGNVKCHLWPLVRGSDDDSVYFDDPIEDVTSSITMRSDYYRAHCTDEYEEEVYDKTHLGIRVDKAIHERPVLLPEDSMGLNVMAIGFDSTSRMAWLRNLQKTHKLLVEKMGAHELTGYNIVGDATTPNLLAFLTGKFQHELPESRRSFTDARPVDGFPWIWKPYRDAGYVTMFGEDESSINTFAFRLLGFREQPTDHYARPFYIVEKDIKCFGRRKHHEVYLDYIHQMYKMYPSRPKFSFFFSSMSHGNTTILQLADPDLAKLIKDLDKAGHLNNTAVIMFGDHGSRFEGARASVQGKYEERLPYFAIRFPPWFKHKYPMAIRNLQINKNRLTTPFDVYKTLQDILSYKMVSMGDLNQRGISLFSEIPLKRTCTQAGIQAHWCTCLNWRPVSNQNKKVLRAANYVMEFINAKTNDFRELCLPLSLDKVINASKYIPNDKLLSFKDSITEDLIPYFGDKAEVTEVLYQLTIRTLPNNGLYEVTVKYNRPERRFTMKGNEISRINKYGNQPSCVSEDHPALRPYCFCLPEDDYLSDPLEFIEHGN